MEPREIFALVNPNKAWVVNELDTLRREWVLWLETSQTLGLSPDFNPMTGTEAIKDGFENRHKHELLREKTLVFIGNNFSGYSFLFENWPLIRTKITPRVWPKLSPDGFVASTH
jgi:hypothetical protein